MHFTLWVTNTDQWSLEELMEPYWQDTEDEKYLEKEVELKGDKQSVKEFVEKRMSDAMAQLSYWRKQEGETSKRQVKWKYIKNRSYSTI